MLYGEFLAGTQQPDNEWTYSEYKRIEAIYNADDSMEKSDAYKLFTEPNELVKDLLDKAADYKAEMITARSLYREQKEEADRLRHEAGEARAQILRLEMELNRYRRAAHDLFYATGTI